MPANVKRDLIRRLKGYSVVLGFDQYLVVCVFSFSIVISSPPKQTSENAANSAFYAMEI
jgi:hypothetical protein